MRRQIPIGIDGGNKDAFLQGDLTPAFIMNMYYNGGYKIFPALTQFSTSDTGFSIDGIFESKVTGTVYVVSNAVLYTLSSAGVLTTVGTTTLTAGVPVSFDEDATYVYMAARSKVNRATASTVAEITTSPVNVTHLCIIGGYLMTNGDQPSGTVTPGITQYSDDGGATWSYYTNDSKPDPVAAILAPWSEVYAIGSDSIEVRYIDGTTPFSANPQARQEIGTPAPYSVAFDKENICFLTIAQGARKIVTLNAGRQLNLISFPVDVDIAKFQSISDARGFMASFDAQTFYFITFPTANVTLDDEVYESLTLAYHLQAKTWYRCGRWNTDEAKYRSHPMNCYLYVEAWGKTLIGALESGVVYEMTFPATADATTPEYFTHRWRNDHRVEWSNGREVSLGVQGDRQSPIRQNGCGRYGTRQHEFIFVQPTADDGGIHRAVIRTGWIGYGSSSTEKIADAYHYEIKRGTGEIIVKGIEEEFGVAR